MFILLYLFFCEYLTLLFFFFFNDTATTEIYTLSLHDALPISPRLRWLPAWSMSSAPTACASSAPPRRPPSRSEEHTSELQSLTNLVCRLLLEKKKNVLQLLSVFTVYIDTRNQLQELIDSSGFG